MLIPSRRKLKSRSTSIISYFESFYRVFPNLSHHKPVIKIIVISFAFQPLVILDFAEGDPYDRPIPRVHIPLRKLQSMSYNLPRKSPQAFVTLITLHYHFSYVTTFGQNPTERPCTYSSALTLPMGGRTVPAGHPIIDFHGTIPKFWEFDEI